MTKIHIPLISVVIIVISLVYAGINELYPWQRTYSTINKVQYSRVKTGVIYDLADTSRKYGSLLGIEKMVIKYMRELVLLILDIKCL